MYSREVLKELCLRDRQTSTLFEMLTLICFFYIKNQIVFQTNIGEIDTLEKNYWYCKSKLLIASLHRLPALKDAARENLSYYA